MLELLGLLMLEALKTVRGRAVQELAAEVLHLLERAVKADRPASDAVLAALAGLPLGISAVAAAVVPLRGASEELALIPWTLTAETVAIARLQRMAGAVAVVPVLRCRLLAVTVAMGTF